MTTEPLYSWTMTLVPDRIIRRAETEMTQYVMTNWSLIYRDDQKPEEGVMMVVVFKRRIMNEMLTTFLPAILLIMITYATTHFDSFYFEAALGVNLTTMLVFTTIYSSVLEKLPPRAYVKMVDIFLICCQMYPFTEVVLLTIIEKLRGTEHVREEDKIRYQ